MWGTILRALRWFAVTIGIVFFTSVTVDSTLNNGSISQSALGILALNAVEEGCAEGTVLMRDAGRSWCVDAFEVAAGDSCAHEVVTSAVETTENLNNTACVPASEKGRTPWTYVTYHQAQELCARRGMRLPTSDEWYMAAVGTPDIEVVSGSAGCNLDSAGIREAGAGSECVSPKGVHDTLGNAWEWVDADVIEGIHEGRILPDSGYVADADGAGVAVRTTDAAVSEFRSDYFWSNDRGVYGMIRGGFFGSEDDGGLYSIQAQVARSFTGVAVGFRCVKDI